MSHRSSPRPVLILCIGALAILALAAGPALADPGPSSPRRPVSFAYDWGGNSDVVTLYKVPKGHRLVLTDVTGYWWDEAARSGS